MRSLKVVGIDEAGRGPVIGPMVICGVLLDDMKIPQLRRIGVKDSKLLSSGRREELGKAIIEIVEATHLAVVSEAEIDRWVSRGALNDLEVEVMGMILKILSPEIAYVDAPDRNTRRFRALLEYKAGPTPEIVAENHAGLNRSPVSAASILAKVRRDEIIDRYHLDYGDFGSGYPSDPKTIKFLRDCITKREELPRIVRASWKTIARLEQL